MVLSTFQLIVKGVNATYNKSMEFCNKKKIKIATTCSSFS